MPAALRSGEESLRPLDAIEYLAREVASRVRERLIRDLDDEDIGRTLSRANELLKGDEAEGAVLKSIRDALSGDERRPIIPLGQSALVTNSQGLNFNAVLRSELLSADRVDLICPFIGNQGLNLIIDRLRALGDRLRVITTTYLGATNQRALERLVETGAQVKIVYERSEQRTGLHAKSWIFHRETGFTTATVGSSNLSPRALVEGLEWNVRLSAKDSSQILEELKVTFERLWVDPIYEPFDPKRDADRLHRALKSQRSERSSGDFFADIHPLPHQQEALDELSYARLEGKHMNLVVAATGTGKTLLAAFDYQRLASQRARPTLLFVAHREDILKQSLRAYKAVLRDSDFGELNVGVERADSWRWVFASVQSLAHRSLAEIDPRHFEILVIDEFHHAEAKTYERLLNHFKPKELLGLTATPERTDGKNVIDKFGTATYELRLWHALERNLLCPFQYFGIVDNTDLTHIEWLKGRYSDAGLERLFVDQGDERAGLIIRELREKVADLESFRAVAFCATVRHADYMADHFAKSGLAARPLHSGMSSERRREHVAQFRSGEVSILCTVDLFNEGVDIPEIDTVLFLRPTESATVFIQQLGRGLRNSPGKGALTVLDFVGQQHRGFRMDRRFQAMTGLSRSQLETSLKKDFPDLPPGCYIRLDRTTQERVLNSLRNALPSTNRAICEELRRMQSTGTQITVGNVLKETGLELGDLYRNGRSLAKLKKDAGLSMEEAPKNRLIGSLTHVDDQRRAAGYRRLLTEKKPDSVFERMLAYGLTRSMSLAPVDALERGEAIEALDVLEGTAPWRLAVASDLPFSLHSHYTRDEIVASFRDNPESMRQGTFYVRELGLDIHLVTLKKSERDFSPTTRYADYFIAPDVLHWESQSTTTAASRTGQRLIKGLGRHLFFVREAKTDEYGAAPFLCLGFAMPISSESECPIKLQWKLEHSVPDHIYVRFQSASG